VSLWQQTNPRGRDGGKDPYPSSNRGCCRESPRKKDEREFKDSVSAVARSALQFRVLCARTRDALASS
jgi:hypothetical protein